jgi:type II secretory pathway pseudopilin PulG
LLISVVLSGIIVLALITGLVIFTGRAAQERTTQKLQNEVELTLHWVRNEIEIATAVPELSAIPGIPALDPVQLALVLPKENQYVLVLYAFGPLPAGFPYDDPSFQRRYGALQRALYRWESPPFDEPTTLPNLSKVEIPPEDLQLVTAYLQPYNATASEQSGLALTQAEGEQGGLLRVNGLRPADFAGNAAACRNQAAIGQCKPLTREVYVYPKNSLLVPPPAK